MANQLVQTQLRALTFRILPTKEQEILIRKTFGSARLVYNFLLNEKNIFYETIIKNSSKELHKDLWETFDKTKISDLKTQFPFLSEVSSQALCQSENNLNTAFKNFINGKTGKSKNKQDEPKFKSKHTNRKSYRECMISKNPLDRENKTIQVPKLGKVKYKRRNKDIPSWFNPEGLSYKNITIKQNSDGKYYAVLLCEREYHKVKKVYSGNENQVIGLDFSPKDLFITHEGKSAKEFGYVAQKQAASKKLAKLERRLAKTLLGSKNHEKARLKVAKIERKIADKRLDFIEKMTLNLVQNYEVIGIEDLNLTGMISYSKNAKNYVDSSWGTFVSKLEWKSSKNENNCQVIKASRFFPSSKTCSHCGFKYKELKLSEREWTCKSCGSLLSRDQNAAENLRRQALDKVGLGQPESPLNVSERQLKAVRNLVTAALVG